MSRSSRSHQPSRPCPSSPRGGSARRNGRCSAWHLRNSDVGPVSRGASPPSPCRPGRLEARLARCQRADEPAQGEGRRARAAWAQSRADAVRAPRRDRPRDRRRRSVGVGGGVGRTRGTRYNEYRIGKVNNGWHCEMVSRAVADSIPMSGNASGGSFEVVSLGRGEPRRGEEPSGASQQADDECRNHDPHAGTCRRLR